MLQLLVCFSLLFGAVFTGDKKSDKEQDGLKGQVGSVRVKKAGFFTDNDKMKESQRLRSHRIHYNKKGEMVEMVAYNYNGDYVSRFMRFTGDAKGNTLATVFERSNSFSPALSVDSSVLQPLISKKVFKHVFKYDGKGNRTEDAVYAEDRTLIHKDVYVFDNKGMNAEVISSDSKGELKRVDFTYDSKGMVTTQSIFEPAGKLIEKRSYTYEFDAQGNWIKQTASKILDNGESEPFEVVYRTISYYPPIGNYTEAYVEGRRYRIRPNARHLIRDVMAGLASSARRRVAPVYPPPAKAARIHGSVIVEVIVDEEGDVLTAQAIQGHPLLKASAEKAALGWKFMPISINSIPLRVVGTLTFTFNL